MKRLVVFVAALSLVPPLSGVAGSAQFRVSAAGVCTTGLTLILHPGLPPQAKRGAFSTARDIPHTPFTVSVPVYPGSRPLATFVASPIPEYPASPYLQTGVAEYQISTSVNTVRAWYRHAFASCGWRSNGSMSGNATILTTGISFVSIGNHNLTMDLTFGDTPSGGAYIAYAAEQITYPLRPAASYLHGSFSQVRIALRRDVMKQGQFVAHIVRRTVTDRPTITQFVRSINALTDYFTVSGICLGGGSSTGPAWLSFVRPDGSMVHAYERGPGGCGGLAVNGIRWLVDPGAVWVEILRLS